LFFELLLFPTLLEEAAAPPPPSGSSCELGVFPAGCKTALLPLRFRPDRGESSRRTRARRTTSGVRLCHSEVLLLLVEAELVVVCSDRGRRETFAPGLGATMKKDALDVFLFS